MGEYAIYHGKKIKIGTCDMMYYLRREDRFKVTALKDNVNSATEKNLFWRLPFPDEDNTGPGGYNIHNRAYPLTVFSDIELAETPGTIHLKHKSGLIANGFPCYHGEKLPQSEDKNIEFSWLGKSWFYELLHIKNTEKGLLPIVSCRFCGKMWCFDWADILPHIKDAILKIRCAEYKNH